MERRRIVSWCVFLLALFLWQTTFDVAKIDINGLARFKPDAVLATTALATGAKGGEDRVRRGVPETSRHWSFRRVQLEVCSFFASCNSTCL